MPSPNLSSVFTNRLKYSVRFIQKKKKEFYKHIFFLKNNSSRADVLCAGGIVEKNQW